MPARPVREQRRKKGKIEAMMTSWVIWIGWLLFIVALNVFTNAFGAVFLLIIGILAPVLSMGLNRLGVLGIKFALDFSETVEKGNEIQDVLKVTNTSFISYSLVRFSLIAKNRLTGEENKCEMKFSVAARQAIELPLKIMDTHCGKISFSLEKARVYDVFGLTFTRIEPEVNGSVLVLPDLFYPDISIDMESSANKGGLDYSQTKPGFDASEPFGFRDYVPGDSLKNIHWKLTQKLDQIIVREPGLPLENSLLILFETGIADAEKRPSPSVSDAMVEVFVSFSQALLGEDIPHSIGWQDQESDNFVRYPISSEEELAGVLPKILSIEQKEDKQFCFEHYIAHFDSCNFAHVVYICSEVPKNVWLFAPGSKVTVLLAQDTIDSTDRNYERSGQIIAFSPQTMDQDLCFVLV